MLRKIRTTIAIIVLFLVTLLFLDFTGSIHRWFGFLAKIQLMPAIMALNIGVIILLVALTLIFGRVYCSVICPLGIFQDVISWFSKRGAKKNKFKYGYRKAHNIARYSLLVIFIAGIVFSIGSLVALLEPYSAFGRMASNLFQPIYIWGNNLFAAIAEHFDSYAFYSKDVWLKSLPTFIIAIATLVLIIVLAWRGGRDYCNTICPVGTVLGTLSRFSYLKPVIDTSKCNGCGLCGKGCKGKCIDTKEHKIDYSRCVVCMDCIDNCKQGAISYRHLPKNTAPSTYPANNAGSRRTFLAMLGMGAVAAANAQEKKVDGGLAVILDKQKPERQTPIVPAGAQGIKHLSSRCTGCQLCVSVCPSKVLRPSTDITRLMQPESSFELGYCRPECTKCSEVCPAGAIVKITKEEKSSIQIGHAVWLRENCLVATMNERCGHCADHCPTGAITLVADPEDKPEAGKRPRMIPAVNTEKCIGCGACENLCPSRPFSAIYVEGHQVHRTI